MYRFQPLTLVIAASLLALVACRDNPSTGTTGVASTTTSTAQQAVAEADSFGADEWGLANAPMMGAANGIVTIVAFSDFECPFCSRVVPTLHQIVESEEFGDKVRIVFKQLPLSFHANAHLAAQASLAAHAQGKFWEYHDLLFENQRALLRPDLERYAERLGLDMEAFRAALDNATFKQQVDDDAALAGRLGVTGTPGFMINGTKFSGAQPFDNFAAALRSEITATQALIDGGQSVGDAYAARVASNLAAAPAAAAPRAPAAAPEPDPNAKMYVPVGNSPALGPADALVTIVAISEFQCPFCNRVRPTLDQIVQTYGNDVRIVFKHLPLSFHDRAEPAARASIAAQNQGKFWEYHDLLFANQQQLTDANLAAWAQQLGLNMDRFNADLQAQATTDQIAEDTALAGRLAVRGTPHFFINGYRLRGAQPFERFKAVIDERLAEAQALVSSGTARSAVYDKVMENAERGAAPMINPPAAPAAAPAAPAAPAGPVDIPVGDAPRRGPANAPVTIQIWTDFECPFCTRFANNLDEAVAGFEDKVQIVVKAFPLNFHPNAHLAAQASLAANAQGKFFEYHDLLFANQRALSRPDLERYAEQLGLNMDTFRAALDNQTYKAEVDAQMAEGQRFGVRGTPGWFVNGVEFGGARPAEAIRAEIERALNAN